MPIIRPHYEEPNVTATDLLRAMAIYPGRPDSLHLTTVPDQPLASHDVAVRVRRVGICGTDRELIDAHFGGPPAGSDELVLGHEVLGVVEATGDKVETLRPGDLVVATVRRPDGCPACQAGQPDMCLWRKYTERGIVGAHGFMVERFVDEERYLIAVPPELEAIGVLVEPLSVVEKALRHATLIQRRIEGWTPRQALIFGAGPIGLLGAMLLRARGIEVTAVARQPPPNRAATVLERCGARYVSVRETPVSELATSSSPLDLILEAAGASELVFEGMRILGVNGVLVALGVGRGDLHAPVPIDEISRGFVAGNKLMFGSVNSAREDFVAGVADLATFEQRWPGLTATLITHRLTAFEDVASIGEHVEDGIKTTIEFER